MRIIDITHPPQSLWIGREGENTFRPVSFECANWFTTYPNATIAAYYQPYGSADPYPLVLVEDGTKRIWHPLLNELVKGDGELQIVLMNGDTVGTSAIIPTRVDRSLISNADHPADEAPSWTVQVVADVQNAIDGIGETVEELLPDAVEDYMVEHPFVETDPTVPAWAKATQKPSYTAAEVGALPDSYTAPVQSVNGKTGVVVLDASDVGALPDDTPIPAAVTEQTVSGWGFTKNTGTYSKPSGGIPKSDLASDVQTSLGKADTALQTAPVTSVNNKTGAVTLGASDVHALPDSTVIPTVPQMATHADMSDWTSGKTVDAATLKTGFRYALNTLENIADAVDSHTGEIGELQTEKANASDIPDASTSAPVMDGTAAVGTSTDYARADHVHPSDTTRLSTTGNAYRSASIPMGHLDATSTATVMTATVDGITELRDGVCMWLRNGVVTSASGFTINVNGLGAKPCYSSLAAASRSTTIFNVNYTMLFVYNSTRVDGGCWDIVYGVDTNTTYTPPKLGFGYAVCTTAAATAAKTASISSYALTAGGIVSIKFDNDVPSGATLNVSSKGAKAIYHKGAAIAADVIKGGDTATFIYSTYYHLISIDRDETGDTLPAVTASDNGKFLRVVNGAWAAATVQTWQGGSY